MTCIDTQIVQQIEAYVTNGNLPTLMNYARANNGWIPIDLLNNCESLTSYNYDRILHALYSKSSNIIELSSFEPRCVRYRRHLGYQSLTKENIEDTQTVIVTGLPMNISLEYSFEFFNQFYPVEFVKKIPSFSQRFPSKLHVIFKTSFDAYAFVEQSKLTSIKYIDNHSSHIYPITCEILNKQSNIFKRKFHNQSVERKSCINSNSCVTEQIRFCQNSSPIKSININEYNQKTILKNKYSYKFYIPDDYINQTHSCIMISVLNPFCFTIQLHDDAIQFDKFQREINEFYNRINDEDYYLTSNDIKKHLCVICLDLKSLNEDKQIWNRSQILDYNTLDNTVNLFYVDLGSWEENVSIDRLRYLTEDFHHQMVLSITCRLARIHPINNENNSLIWRDDATNQFLAVIEHNILKIEFLTVNSNGCFNTNLYVNNSSQYICINDYLIYIKQAKLNLIDDNEENNDEIPPIHPVVCLYNQLGEISEESRSVSITTSSSIYSSSSSTKSSVKIKQMNININSIHNSKQQIIPIIFIQYQKSILMPDFTIVNLLQLIHPDFNHHIIENYVNQLVNRRIT